MIADEGAAMSDALSIITKNVADALLLKNKGSVEAGKDADIVLLDADLNVTDAWANGNERVRDSVLVAKDYYQY